MLQAYYDKGGIIVTEKVIHTPSGLYQIKNISNVQVLKIKKGSTTPAWIAVLALGIVGFPFILVALDILQTGPVAGEFLFTSLSVAGIVLIISFVMAIAGSFKYYYGLDLNLNSGSTTIFKADTEIEVRELMTAVSQSILAN